jgi:peptide/nickel transport system permease protein
MALPFYVLVIAIVAMLGPGLGNMYLAMVLAGWVSYARLFRGEILTGRISSTCRAPPPLVRPTCA